MSGFVVSFLVGIVCIVLGISNMRGNISSLHSYHTHRVSEEDRIPFGKMVGLGTIIVGAGIMILNMLIRPLFPVVIQSPINCGVVAMVGGLILVPIVSWLTPKLNKEMVESVFSCYNKKVTVDSKKSLGE